MSFVLRQIHRLTNIYKTILYFAIMKKSILSLSLLFTLLYGAIAQTDYGYVQKGEFGFTAGVAHYFGDLNTRAQINRPKPAVGVFYRKQFNNYLALRVSAHYAQVGYSDIYSKNKYQNTRNLSFNSDIIEFAVHGDFNFLKFVPGDPEFSFTPFATIGIGIFSYNPYAYLNGKKYFFAHWARRGKTFNIKVLIIK